MSFKYPKLMKYFEEISAIPRGSFNEGKIASYICGFAKERGLEFYKDGYNNVLINCPASKGREGEEALLLQGHTDMVCEKNEGACHDFLNDGLKLYEENGWLRARGTTLGADNGVAVAVMLYLLDGAAESHPPLQCLFTSAEEVGLVGAKAFDYSKIYAKRMINMDSADEALIICGCAGGQRVTLRYKLEKEKAFGKAVKIKLSGLAGGHSGEDIDKGRANANKLLGRVLLQLSEDNPIRLASVFGGSKDNAIPREASAVVVCTDAKGLLKAVACIEKAIKSELCAEDRGFSASADICEAPLECFSARDSEKLIFVLSSVANGVFEYNRELPEIVEFSRNLGVVTTNDSGVELVFSSRSAFLQRLDFSNAELARWAELFGGELVMGEGYPGWSYSPHSPLREAYAEAYRKIYGRDARTTVIHAGLECGIISERLSGADIISCGPIVNDLHSPDEALSLVSFEGFFSVIKELLANI